MMHMMRLGLIVAVGLVFAGPRRAAADAGGWSYLIEKLVNDGIARERVLAAFSDSRVGPFAGLTFSAETPHESRHRYRRFLRPATLAAAHRCRTRYADAFAAAERAYGVSADVVAAILFIESGCGRNTGSTVVMYRLARLAMANEPYNLQRNLDRYADLTGRVDPQTAAQLRARARYLEDTFYPEVRALFAVADRMGVEALAIRGSTSGAFGAPQFLPTNYLTYGVDADGDGAVSLYAAADAAASCANFIADHGWRPGLSTGGRRAVIWQYNHSPAYVDTVLSLAARINAVPGRPATRVTRRKPAKGHRQRRVVETAARARTS